MLSPATALMLTSDSGGTKTFSPGETISETTFSALMIANKMIANKKSNNKRSNSRMLIPAVPTATPLTPMSASGVMNSLFPSRTRDHAVHATLSPPPKSSRLTTLLPETVLSPFPSSRLLTAVTVVVTVATVDGPHPSSTLLLTPSTPSLVRRITNMLLELRPAPPPQSPVPRS